jgi:hypothetical protein
MKRAYEVSVFFPPFRVMEKLGVLYLRYNEKKHKKTLS